MAIFETHCHLNHPLFDEDCDAVIVRAIDANVKRLLVVSYDLTSSRRALNLANSHPVLSAAIGIHPEDADQWTDSTREEFSAAIGGNAGKIVACGEIGLDYHWKTFEPTVQKRVFVEQIKFARSHNLPIIVHCRDAYDDTLDILEEHGGENVVVHCFTGTPAQAGRAVRLGCYIGIGGVITYKNAADVRAVAETVPLSRLLLETDAPFLAPQSWRGKRNEPSYITAVSEKLASLLELTKNDVEETTWQNAVSLFG